MPVLDVFAADAFSMSSLTEAVNKLPYVPGRVSELAVFQSKGVRTPRVDIEERDGVLYMVDNTVRGNPPALNRRAKRTVRSFTCTHLPVVDSVKAEEVASIRTFGSETQLQSVAGLVNDQMAQMKASIEATREHLRMGALQGIILDADGSTTIYDLYTEFGTSPTTQDFDFAGATPTPLADCLTVKRAIETALGGATYKYIHCLCGDTFFDEMIADSTVEAAFERWQTGAFLRGDFRNGFEFGGIFFENYRGSIDSVDFVAPGSAHFFPVGVPGLFVEFNAPADYIETVNTMGQPMYAKQERQAFDKGIDIEVQANPLPMCVRPKCLVKGTNT